MVPLDQAVVARLESHGRKIQLLVDPDEAVRFRQGEQTDIEAVVAALHVFENASHGKRASDEALTKVFHTTEFPVIAKKIIEKGEIHLTADQKRQMTADKRKQVVTFISRNSINPQTGTTSPPQRIEMAMDEARVNIDPFRHLDELVKDTVKALRPLIPIRFEEYELPLKFPQIMPTGLTGISTLVVSWKKKNGKKTALGSVSCEFLQGSREIFMI